MEHHRESIQGTWMGGAHISMHPAWLRGPKTVAFDVGKAGGKVTALTAEKEL